MTWLDFQRKVTPILWIILALAILGAMVWDMMAPSEKKHQREVEESRREVYEKESK